MKKERYTNVYEKELYNATYRQWEDGLFTQFLKHFNEDSSEDMFNWIVLDGPVSPGKFL